MNLAFCIFKYYPFGGLEKNFIRITEECLKRGHSISIYTMSWTGDIPETLRRDSCRIEIIKGKGISNHSRCASFVKTLQQKLKENPHDFITGFNRMPELDLYYCADVCYKADIRKRRSPLHTLTSRYKIYSRFEDAVFNSNSKTHILILSDIQKKIYQNEYGTPDTRFHPIPAGIDKNFIRTASAQDYVKESRKKLQIKDNSLMLLMIGSDFKRKGVIRSINAVASLPENIKSKTMLFIAGKGKSDKLARTADKLNVNITFTGPLTDIRPYLAASDLLLHPAVSENTGNAIVEALISGTPVIATSNCGYAFHVDRSKAGRVINGFDYSQEEFNRTLSEFLTELPEKKPIIHQNAIDYTDKTDLYSRPETVADIIEELYSRKD